MAVRISREGERRWNNTIMIVITDITMGYLSLLSIRTIIVALQQ
jgi:hypothetical protein